ncbi:MAG: hypothetical protein WCP20_15760 [Desulfuromonadales bacterium]
MKKNTTTKINRMKSSNVVGKTASAILFLLSLVIVYELVKHGQTTLGAYMFLSQMMEKLHHLGKGSEAAEHIVHINAHGPQGH